MDLLIDSLKINRHKLFIDEELSEINSWVIIEGNSLVMRNDDVEYKFRQNHNFFWLTGIELPDYSVAIHIKNKKLYLLPPKYDDDYPIWNGKLPDFDEMKNTLMFHSIEFNTSFFQIDPSLNNLYVEKIYSKIEEYRIIKNSMEIQMIKRACSMSMDAHQYLMENIKYYVNFREKAVLNKFVELTENNDNVEGQAYPPVCGCGENSAILHYVCTDYGYMKTKIKEGEVFLIDAGCEYLNYASDITRTYGVGNIDIYRENIIEDVTKINFICKSKVKEGAVFKEIYELSLELIYQAILKMDILNENGKSMDKQELACLFMPHSLGHFIGLAVHDVGGKLYTKSTDTSVILKENMVITIEPGIYFNKYVLNKHSDLWNDNIKHYENIGGIRVEDVVAVKKNGYVQLN